jgi:hypothetical protein
MRNIFIYTLLAAILLASCSDNENPNTQDFEVPATYTFLRDGVSTVDFSGQTTRISMAEELISSMQDENITEEQLLEMFRNETSTGTDANPYMDAALNESTKSIKSKVAASSDLFSSNTLGSAVVKADFENWIAAQVSEVFPNYNELATPGVAGQIADGTSVRYVSAKGLEYNQAVNKSLIGALMLDQIVNNYLSPAVLDAEDNIATNDADIKDGDNAYTSMEHKWDEAYGYLFGTAADTADPVADIGNADSFLNKYVGRVEGDEDFAGITITIHEAFKKGRAAIVAKDYTTRDQQADILKEELSKIIAIRAVYYLQQGKNSIPEDGNIALYGTSFHDLSEGFGFVYSLIFTRIPGTTDAYFSRDELDNMLSVLTAGNGFWDLTPEVLDQISEQIAAKFDFTVVQAGS